MKQPDLEIIIVTFDSEFWLKKTLASLQQFYLSQTQYAVQVTVVDNASTDDTVRLVKSTFPWVQLMQEKVNAGFAVGNNAALKKSKARYVMLMNSDVESTVHSNFDVLIDFLENHTEVACITPKVVFSSGALDPACHRGEPTLWASFTYFCGLETMLPSVSLFSQYHQWYKKLDTIHTIDACSGAAMLIRRSVLEEVGYLDERFFMYAEDLDLCKRMRDAGYLITYHPQVSLIHHKYKSGIKGSSKKIARSTRRHFYDTMLQYYDKHYGKTYPYFVRIGIKVFTVLKKGAL